MVVGAGAIGGAIGGLLHRAGHDVVLVARGEHGRTMAERGLLLKRPDEEFVIDVTVALDIAEVELTADDVLILATKSQHTAGLVEQIAPMPVTGAPDGTTAGDVLPIVCAQNGVANETVALRRFARVYGLLVQQPTTFLEPGIVAAHGLPQPGILPIGRFPHGVDETAERIAAALRDAGFGSDPRDDVMAWKYTKLLANLHNGTRVLLKPSETDEDAELARQVQAIVRAEGEAALTAAGIAWTPESAFRGDRDGLAKTRRAPGEGSSTWQSLARGAGSTEVDYLNGEIVLLGRLHGVPTPANTLIQRVVNELTITGGQPGVYTPAEMLELIRAS